VALALRDNRTILLKTEDIKKAKEKIAEASASLFPSLTLTGGWTDTRGLYAKDLGQTTTQATLKQYLYRGGKTIATLNQNRDKLEVSQALLDTAKLGTIVSVKNALYTLLLAREFSGVNKGIVANTQAHLTATEARYKNGQASESDILKFKDYLGSVEQAHEASLNQVETAQAVIRNLLYLDEEVTVIPDVSLVYEPRQVAYEEGFLKAMKARPEIRQYEAQEKVDAKSIEVLKADNRPSVYASWDYYSRSHLSVTTSRNWNDYNVIGVTFSWPVFDGWATKAKIEQALIDVKETRLAKEKTIKDIALELKNAYVALKNSIAAVKAQETQLASYKDVLSATEDKYKAGIASVLDVHDASLSYEISLFNQKQALYDYVVAKSNFDKATGAM
jgi:outer membrane protein